MVTKHKIVAGFSVMIFLLLVLGAVGYRNVITTSALFSEYDRRARVNVIFSDTISFMFSSGKKMEEYIFSPDAQIIASAQEDLDRALELGESAVPILTVDSRRRAMESCVGKIRELKLASAHVESAIVEGRRHYYDVFIPAMASLHSRGQSVSKALTFGNNASQLNDLVTFLTALSEIRVTAALYSMSFDPVMEARALAALDPAKTALARLDRMEHGPGIRAELKEMDSALARLEDSFTRFRDANHTVQEARAEALQTQASIQTILEDLHEATNKDMIDYGILGQSQNDLAKLTMLIISISGLIIGLVLAVCLVAGLVRVLKRLSLFANAVADGDFSFDHRISEKGEIGSVVLAVGRIVTTLRSLVAESGSAANDISSGKYLTRLDTGRFNGDFRKLAAAINTVSESYINAIDTLPVSIITADKDLTLLYMNSLAREYVPDALGKKCYDALDADICRNKETCLGCQSMERKDSIQSEMSVASNGQRLDFLMTVNPLMDNNGEVVGMMEILSDITKIKSQQETINQVAEKASSISDRVAAAAEQLASQVEEVSRGAELQKERMEATATAMAQMNSTVIEVARNAGEASEQSDTARKNAEQGEELVNKVVEAINNVNQIALKLQHNMETLGEQANNIGGVMHVISDIADQTNLLALNAAIEAARAGEAGRGFSVVADEVRKLAEKTMSATKEVGRSIEGIQHSTQSSIEEVSSAVESVRQSTELADASGTALHDIVQLASYTSSIVASIATAAEQQSTTSEEISQAMDSINTIVAETTEGTIESSTAVQALARMASELRDVMDGIK